MYKILIGWGLLAAMLLGSRCGGGKSALAMGAAEPATAVRSVDFLQKQLQKNAGLSGKIKDLSARVDLYTETNEQSISAQGTLIWYRDQFILLAVRKFGIEGLRIKVTPDSIHILDRLQKTYTATPLQEAVAQFNLPKNIPPFQVMQEALLGLPSMVSGQTFSSDTLNQLHRLKGALNGFLSVYMVEEGSFLLRSASFAQASDGSQVNVVFSERQAYTAGGYAPPRLLKASVDSREYGKNNIEIKQTDVNYNTQPSWKFEIPSHYTRSKP
jgi:Domain of unknown function (DUF4292)